MRNGTQQQNLYLRRATPQRPPQEESKPRSREGINRAQLFGNLGAEPELRSTSNGTSVLNLRLATTTGYKGADGQWTQRTDWHSVVVWGKRAEGLAKILTVGSAVYVEGEIRTSSWETDSGEKRYRTEIHASTVLLTGGERASNDSDGSDDIPF